MPLHCGLSRLACLAVGLLALVAVATACVSSATVRFKGVAPLNPAPEFGDEARPVRVRIYQLKDDANFDKASHDDLWERPDDVLKGDAVGNPRVVDIFADDAKEVTLEIETGTRFIGVLALYRQDPSRKDSQYRQIIPVRDVETLNVVLTKYQVKTEPR